MPEKSVHCCVTSPPYYTLRDYGVPGMIGLEDTFQEYLDKLLRIFMELKRVLRDDGTLWLNIGDTWAQAAGKGTPGGRLGIENNPLKFDAIPHNRHNPSDLKKMGLKKGDLWMMPAEIAIMLRKNGWHLRSEIIWHKNNPTPCSTKNRPTSSHEQIYLLSPGYPYYYDATDLRTPYKASSLERLTRPGLKGEPGGIKDDGTGNRSHRKLRLNQSKLVKQMKWDDRYNLGAVPGANIRDVWKFPTESFDIHVCKSCRKIVTGDYLKKHYRCAGGFQCDCGNMDWVSHFAAFPREIPRRAIVAGTSDRGACPECGIQWVRQDDTYVSGQGCEHPDLEPVPSTVLDIFAGSGTTLEVATDLGRKAIGIELNEYYIEFIKHRVSKTANQVKLPF